MNSIAVLISSFNRKEKTISAIEGVYGQKNINKNFKVSIYLLDDNSKDGTAQEVRLKYPDVNLIKGSGVDYWNGGMNKAFIQANKKEHDFYMWLNDDTFLYEDAFEKLLNTNKKIREKVDKPIIVVGTAIDSKGKISYGGVTKKNPIKLLSFELVTPSKSIELQTCDTFNGNLVLIEKKAYDIVGGLDQAFIHGMGDFDFGLRAKSKGVQLYVSNEYLCTCDKNPIKGTYHDTSINFYKGFKMLLSIKGLPIKQWFIFTKRHGGMMWYLYFIKPYLEYIPKRLFAFLKRKLSLSNLKGV